MVRLVKRFAIHPECRHEPGGVVKSYVPFALSPTNVTGADHHGKNVTWFRGLMPAHNFIARPIRSEATDGARLLDRSAARL